MIINEQGKLFGKVSIVDAGIVLVILLTIVVLFVRFINPVNMFGQSKSLNCEYTITVKNVRVESVEAMKKSIGESMFDTQKINLGKVKEITEIIPSESYVYKVDGTVVKAPQPERYDMKVKIESPANKGKSGVLVGGKKEILIGSHITMSTPEITVETTISDVKIK